MLLNGPYLLVLFRVLRQRVVYLLAWLIVYGDWSWESLLCLLTITSVNAPLLGHSIGSGFPVLSESPGILRPQRSTWISALFIHFALFRKGYLSLEQISVLQYYITFHWLVYGGSLSTFFVFQYFPWRFKIPTSYLPKSSHFFCLQRSR